MRVGVVGVGKMGYHHARIYSELAKEGKVELIGVADINFERAKEVAETFKTRAFKDYRELIKEGVDAVSIAVPTSLHREVTMDFIENEVSVLVEKPIAESIESAQEIIKAAKKMNVVLMVGHVERFNPAVLKLKETIERGMLGEIVTMTAKRVGPMVTRISDVGVIIDLAVHDIDVMSFLTTSRVIEVYAKARNVKHPAKVEDYALILLSFENGANGIIETNRLTPHKTRTLNVVGTEGIAYLDYINQELTLYNEEWIYKAKINKEEPLKLEIEHFLECVKEGKKPLVGGEEGLHALKVAVKALESSKKDEVVRVS
ncbi:UDP-N-acetylglucosamine 3-dehydrogenase [Pyrococcus abyssi]|uniref:NADH dependent dehydrogenase homolog n=1 Tax=Pyrococcus abyssi (strain GE5 / Orsay) TaxID=272844 RepID=Q9UZI3_PYRAB|nr:UDP-N-acetylglucosamine 3-dehydrogenase [Pyrococcus abyssi]CAB50074.1 NADH dependent dehydrogenase homolog [Pyrococcus abyssi GE5]CCE70580.1 TPA: NADH-dependent dehydrogenase-like [Pyrococcus abyssi GE5]